MPEQPEHIPNPPPNPPNPPPNVPNQPQQPPENPLDIMQLPDTPQAHHLNWSYFKPEFSDKTEEDAAVHLLKTNDWMETHNFPEDTKLRRFCLTLTGEARLWYESIRPIEMDWTDSKNTLGSNIPRLVVQERNIFMYGDHFCMMKIQTL